MRKTTSIFVIAMFVLSMIPLAYAQGSTAANDASGETKSQNKENDLRPIDTQRIEQIKQINEERKETIKSFEECIKNAKEQYPNSSEEKIAQKCKEESGFAAGNEKLREKLKNIGNENKLRIAVKLSEKNPKISEMMVNMTNEEAKTFIELNREQQKEILKEGKKAISKFKVEKVAKEKAFKKREVTKEKMKNAKEKFAKAEEKYKNAKEDYKNAKDNFEKALKAGNDTEAKKYAKEFLANAADQVISSLEKIKENALGNEALTETEVLAITSEADEKIAEMQKAKTALESAETKEEIKAAGKEIIKAWERIRLAIKVHAAKAVEAKVGEIIKRSESLEKKLERVLADMEEKGIDTSSIDPKVDEFSAKVSEAKTLFNEGRELFIKAKEIKVLGNLTETQKEKAEGYVSDSKEKISAAHEALKDAHQILMDIVKEVKNMGGNIETDDESTEVIVTDSEEEALDEEEEALDEQEVETVEVNTESVSVSTSDDETTVITDDVTVSTSEDGTSVSTGNVDVSTSDDETTVTSGDVTVSTSDDETTVLVADNDEEDDTVVLVGDDDTLVDVSA